MTSKEMRDEVVNFIGLQDITDFSETGMVGNWIYRGIIDVLSRTRCVVRCVDLRVRSGVDEYTLDHSILSLVDMENGTRRRLRRGESGYGFTLVRSDVLLLKPTPSEDGEVQVWGVLRPQQMLADTDTPAMEQFGALPDEFHDAPVLYALWKAADYSDDASSQLSERYRILYEGQDGRGGRLAQIKVLVNKRGTARAPRARVTLAATSSHDNWV